MELSLALVGPAVLAVLAVTAFAVRTWVKARLEHAFRVELEEIRARHEADLERIRAFNAERLEEVRAEAAAWVKEASVQPEVQRAAMMEAVVVRAEKYPLLVGCLREMKTTFEYLAKATQQRPIDLSARDERAELAGRALDELLVRCGTFDRVLTEVRMFTTRSDFSLPKAVEAFVERWKSGSEGQLLVVSEEVRRHLSEGYADDLAHLTAEFYGWRPESPGVQRVIELVDSGLPSDVWPPKGRER